MLVVGAAPDFWVSYVLANLSYTGSETLLETLGQVFSFTDQLQLLPFYGICALGVLIFAMGVFSARRAGIGPKRWDLIGVLAAYAAGALFAVARPVTFFLHYRTSMLFPIACFSGALISHLSPRGHRAWLAWSAIVTVIFVSFNGYAYAVVNYHLYTSGRLSHSQ